MCNSCDVLVGALSDMWVSKISQVIRKRAVAELRGHESTVIGWASECSKVADECSLNANGGD